MMVPVPLGYRFMPTNEEVIKYYLWRRAMGLPMPATRHIVERPLYGEYADPRRVLGAVDDSHWDILQQQEGSESTDRVIYVLTKLTKAGNRRVARRAGKGTWSGQTGGKDIRDSGSGQLIGTLKMFSYEADPGERNDGDVHHWIMHEYSLAGNNIVNGEYVICKIRRTSNKRKEFICGQHQQHDLAPAPSPSFKKHKAAHPPPPPPVLINNNNQQLDLVFTPPTINNDEYNCSTPHVLAAHQYNNNIPSVVVVGVGVDDDKTQPAAAAWAAGLHNVIDLDDDDVDVACPNNVVGDGMNKLLDDDDHNKKEECTHDMERPSSNHNVAGSTNLVDSVSDADNLMRSLDDLEEPADFLDGLEFNLDDLDMYFTDCFVP